MLRMSLSAEIHHSTCMTQNGRMLVLEPIFEADLPPEQYAYRPGPIGPLALRTPQRLR
jgi:hypothetical protein